MHRYLTVLHVLTGLFLAGLGGFTVFGENQAYLAGVTPADRVTAWVSHPPHPGLSIYTQKLTLLDCENALIAPDSLAMRFQPADARAGIPATCASIASQLTTDSPSHGYAWYIGALAAEAEQDWVVLNDQLFQSHATSSSELWLAQRRVRLYHRQSERLTPENIAAERADIALVVPTAPGFTDIADIYFSSPQFRSQVAEIAETLEPQYQAKLLTNISSAISARTSRGRAP
jgi:hypothetical protein